MGLHILNILNEGSSVPSKSPAPCPRDYSLSGLRLHGDLVFRRKIGSGTFGLIYLVEDRRGRQYAAKILLKERGRPETNSEQVYRTFAQPPAVKEIQFDTLLAWEEFQKQSSHSKDFGVNPNSSNPYSSNPYSSNPNSSNPNSSNPYSSNPNSSNPNSSNPNSSNSNSSNPNSSNPYSPNPYSPNPYSPNPYRSNPYSSNDSRSRKDARDGTSIVDKNDPTLASLAPFKHLLQEVALHAKVHGHQNIATLHHVYLVQDTALVAVMDYFPDGDLFGAIIDGQMFSNPPSGQNKQLLMKNCMLQLIDAVRHCASHGVYHCDLKPENIMVSYNRTYVRRTSEPVDYDELRVTLIDFGLAMSSDWVCCNVCRGSNFYMAPERIVNFSSNKLVRSLLDMAQFHHGRSARGHDQVFFPTLAGDVWSLGVLFINVTCARNPWPIANIDDRQDVFFTYILRDKFVLSTILPISRQFNHLLNDIFMLNPNERVSLATLAPMIRACDFFNDRPISLDPPSPLLEDLQVEVSHIQDLPKRPHADVNICKHQLRAFEHYDQSRYVS